jgi:hypothetical protein
MSRSCSTRDVPAAVSIHWTDSGRRPVKKRSRCTLRLLMGPRTTTIREGLSFWAASMVRNKMGRVPTRASGASNSLLFVPSLTIKITTAASPAD